MCQQFWHIFAQFFCNFVQFDDCIFFRCRTSAVFSSSPLCPVLSKLQHFYAPQSLCFSWFTAIFPLSFFAVFHNKKRRLPSDLFTKFPPLPKPCKPLFPQCIFYCFFSAEIAFSAIKSTCFWRFFVPFQSCFLLFISLIFSLFFCRIYKKLTISCRSRTIFIRYFSLFGYLEANSFFVKSRFIQKITARCLQHTRDNV